MRSRTKLMQIKNGRYFAMLLLFVTSFVFWPNKSVGSICTKAPAVFEDGRIYLKVKAKNEILKFYTDSGGGIFPFVYDDTAKKLKMKVNNLQKEGGSEVGLSDFPKDLENQNIPIHPSWKNSVRVFTYKKEIKDEANEIRFMIGDGFFGATLFADKIWKFDYINDLLLWCKELETTDGFTVIPAYFKIDKGQRVSHQPRIEIEVDNLKYQVLFDTGATSYYSADAIKQLSAPRSYVASSFIRQSVADKWLKKNSKWKVIKLGDKFGGGGDLVEVPELKIAGQTVGPVWFATRNDAIYDKYSEQIMDSNIDGAIGGNVFKHFEIVADYPSAKFYFKKGSSK